MNETTFAGKVAVVTGGAQGIGAACAEALAARGCTVAVIDINERKHGEAATPHTPNIVFFKGDVGEQSQVDSTFAAITKQLGTPTLLVNNAAVASYVPFSEMTERVWDETMRVNLKGPYLCSRAAIPGMQRLGRGSIVNLASAQAFVSQYGVSAYAASKSGLLGLTRTIAIDCAPLIRCNAVCPGSIDTPMLQDSMTDNGSGEAKEATAGMHLLNRIGQPSEVAELVLFLLSDRSSFITGQALRIDGGIGAWIGALPRDKEAVSSKG